MKKPEWPGITAAVGVLLLIAIAMDLSKWQPIMASLIALTGGYMAYRGAMAKVDHDQKQSQRELLRRQLSLYLKLDLALERLLTNAGFAEANIVFASGNLISPEVLKVEEPSEFVEVWDNLDILPRPLIRDFATIKKRLKRAEELLAEVEPGRMLFGGDSGQGGRLDIIHKQISETISACRIIRQGIAPEIERLAPRMPKDERDRVLYGTYDSDDIND